MAKIVSAIVGVGLLLVAAATNVLLNTLDDARIALVAGLVLLGFAGGLTVRGSPRARRAIDWSFWNVLDNLTISQWACLWARVYPTQPDEPLSRIEHREAYPRHLLLRQAIARGELAAAVDRKPNRFTRTSRANLKRWFVGHRNGEKPLFLYPPAAT